MDLISLKKVFSSLPSLYIIYNVNEKKIEWCNLEEPGKHLKPAYESFLLSINKKEIKSFKNEWEYSIKLNPNECYSFLCSLNSQNFFYNCAVNATGISIEEYDQPFLLIECIELDQNPLQVEIEHLQKALTSSEKKLAQTQNVQSDFIALASHDLQSPIRKLNLYIDKLIAKNKTTIDSDSLFYVDRIKILCRQATLLIDDLALLSDLKNEIKIEDCDLNKTVQELIEEMAVLRNENTFIVKDYLPVIKGDCSLIKNLLSQLLSNAIIFKKENVPLNVTINSTMLSNKEKEELQFITDKSFYKITLTDNGMGFDQQYNDKIFLPFYKLQGNSIHKGSGLGLAICKLIAERHNGLIYATGEMNLGAQFTLILPAI